MKTKLHLLFFAILFSIGSYAQDAHFIELVGGKPGEVTVGSTMDFTVNYTLDTNSPDPSQIIVRFLSSTNVNLGFKQVFVNHGSGTVTLKDVPTPTTIGGGYKLQVRLFEPDPSYSPLVEEIYEPFDVVAPKVKSSFLFNTDGDREGWFKANNTTKNDVSGGVMTIAGPGWNKDYIEQKNFRLNPNIHSYVHVKYKNLSTENVEISFDWITTGATRAGEGAIARRKATITTSTSGTPMPDFETISVDLSTQNDNITVNTEWIDTANSTVADATNFRIYYGRENYASSKSQDFIIESIVFSNSATPTNIFIGTDNDWSNTANWSQGSVPSPTTNIIISQNKGVDVTNLVVDPAASFVIESGGSLKVSGTASGNVTYNRTVDFVDGDLKGWFLMGAPVASQDYDDSFVTANDIAVKGSNRGISTYNTTTDNWVYHQGATSGTFAAGTGYSVKRGSSSGTVSFTGTVNVDDAGVSVPLSNTGSRFNLLGNPYTAYLSSATFLDNEVGISDSKTMWVYNKNLGTNGQYEPKTVLQNFIIAPGQGFFVQANAVTPGSFNFSEANQSHNGTDTFQKTANVQGEITLSMTDGTINNYGKVYYVNKATKSLDIGYEGELFSGQTNDFAIYTHLVSNNVGKKYQVQSLPNSDYENMIVPVGIKAAAGKEITISATSLNLPENIKVYLEDRAMNVVTDLNSADYKVTLNSALDGVGRFFLRTSASSVLSTDTNTLSGISIYKTNNATLKIVGLQQGTSNVKLFNILGKQILNNSFEATGAKEISLPKLATGVYIVQLETAAGKLNKKIILE